MNRAISWAIILALTLSGCGMWDRSRVPDLLLGTWETGAPKYQGCSFTVTGETITFDNGAGHADVNYIKKLTITREGERTVFQIRYENRNDAVFNLALHYSEQKGEAVIRFGNQMHIAWRKRGAETGG